MKRYEFNLAAALRVRKIHEDMAKSELHKARAAAAAAELVAQQSLAHFEQVRNRPTAPVPGAEAPGPADHANLRPKGPAQSEPEWMQQAERQMLAAQAAMNARESLDAARTVAVAAMDKYMAATQAVAVLGHLDEHRREEHAAAAQREEMAAVDDMVTSRHVRRQARLNRKGQV
ncbi:MAG TPA: hypothetical protein VME46_16500 [Acidimicrobiales bacterium]|nr:hypothetical protein [Acidimicrobiales bacterium]